MIENALSSHPSVTLAAAVGMPDSYAGELPVVYVTLRQGASVSTDELHEHAQRTISERPAWPKHIHIVDAIPLTTVGKVYKPQLRCDASTRAVTDLVHQLGLRDSTVQTSLGGQGGLCVIVTLPQRWLASVAELERALGYSHFEAVVVSVSERRSSSPSAGSAAGER
jgi:fatty-acyl-CoA synthase